MDHFTLLYSPSVVNTKTKKVIATGGVKLVGPPVEPKKKKPPVKPPEKTLEKTPEKSSEKDAEKAPVETPDEVQIEVTVGSPEDSNKVRKPKLSMHAFIEKMHAL